MGDRERDSLATMQNVPGFGLGSIKADFFSFSRFAGLIGRWSRMRKTCKEFSRKINKFEGTHFISARLK